MRAQGLRILLSRHKHIRSLKRTHSPSAHGNRPWSSSWLLIDYLKRKGLPERIHVLEVGCGWGLSGIFCARKFHADVTAADIDPDVFPYLQLHAEINGVRVQAVEKGFDDLRIKHLRKFHALIAADVCFWDSMVEPLRRLFSRAVRAGVRLVLIADPGRSTFFRLQDRIPKHRRAEMITWKASRPRAIEGHILRIGRL